MTTRARGTPWYVRGWARLLRPLLMLPIVLLVAGATPAAMAAPAVTSCPDAFVPAFFGPGADWTQTVDSQPVPTTMILDITNLGPGSAPQAGFKTAVKQARAAGITVLGYSATQYAQRSVGAVEADVRHYKAWYGVTDIFLDQVTTTGRQLPYYRTLDDYIHGHDPGASVWLNPGTYPSRRYMSVGDVVMVYEGPYASYAKLHTPRWVSHYPASRFAHTIFSTPSSDLVSAIALAKHRHAGYVYVTDGSGSDPYSALPSYWSTEDARLGHGCSLGGSAPALASATTKDS